MKSKLKNMVLTCSTGIAMFGQNNWDVTWLPIQAGMFLLGVIWDVMFIAANFPTFERK